MLRKSTIITFILVLLLNCLITVPLLKAQTYDMATSTVTTCSGTFFDPGGSTGNHETNDVTMTFCSSTPGEVVEVDFTSFSLALFATLNVYNGPDNTGALIGSFTSNPGIVTSVTGCLTFEFVASGFQSTGWEATISCVVPPAPSCSDGIQNQDETSIDCGGICGSCYNMTTGTVNTCSGKFYDSGGASGNYSNNESIIQTFCSDQAGEGIQFDFTEYDILDEFNVYNGPDTTYPLIPEPTLGFSIPFTLTSSNTCLTFEFISDSINNESGWTADISCIPPTCSDGIRNQGETDVDCGGPCAGICFSNPGGTFTDVCSGTFYDSGGRLSPYGTNEDITTTFCPTAGSALLFDFGTVFSVQPNSGDALTIYDGPTTASSVIGVFDGIKLNGANIIAPSGGCLTFRFTSDASGASSYNGWAAEISCYVPSCSDGILNQGECVIDCGGPCPDCPVCDNPDFETGDFTGWAGSIGVAENLGITYYDFNGATTLPSAQHSIMNVGDVDVCNLISTTSPVGNHSVRLGDGKTSGSVGETIEHNINVTETNTNLTYWYAVVLEEANHIPSEQPFFKTEIIDCDGNSISCAEYTVVAGAGIPDFNISNGGNCGSGANPVYYRDWTPIFVDLSPFIGDNVTLRYTVGDCQNGGHYAYAYVDATCESISDTTNYSICPGDNVTLNAPDGGASYLWSPDGEVTQSIIVSPLATTTYSVTLTSVTGCNTDLTHIVDASCILPANLVNFESSCENGKIIIKWKTLSERSNSSFTIEHSLNGKNWSTLNVVKGAGNSNRINQYSFNTNIERDSKAQLRLKITDTEGKHTYSKIINSSCNSIKDIIFIRYEDNKNPTLLFNTPEGGTIQIYDPTGRLIQSWKLLEGKHKKIINHLHNGMYIVTVKTGTQTEIKKLLISN